MHLCFRPRIVIHLCFRPRSIVMHLGLHLLCSFPKRSGFRGSNTASHLESEPMTWSGRSVKSKSECLCDMCTHTHMQHYKYVSFIMPRLSIKKKRTIILPAITIEQPTSSSSNATGSATRRLNRPKSISVCTVVDHTIPKAPKRRSNSSHPTSPNSAPTQIRRTLSRSISASPHRGPQPVAEQHRIEPTAAEPKSSNQQLAEMMVKFILASDNPELKAALKKAVESDPKIAESL